MDKWEALKADIITAVDIGLRRGHAAKINSHDGGRYTSYRYVLDKMKQLEYMENESESESENESEEDSI